MNYNLVVAHCSHAYHFLVAGVYALEKQRLPVHITAEENQVVKTYIGIFSESYIDSFDHSRIKFRFHYLHTLPVQHRAILGLSCLDVCT